jgi:hypothetical protein
MVKVCILQTDNRINLEYILLTQQVNKKLCNYFGYNYKFVHLEISKYNMDSRTAKIFIVHEFLKESNDDILVFLDSDAWINDGFSLNDIINNIINDSNKHGCFSRDPYLLGNTFINSGSFILKINDYTRGMYDNLTNAVTNDLRNNIHSPEQDQTYISNFLLSNIDNFVIYIPEILNTPFGKVLRHNWCKQSKKLFEDLDYLLSLKEENITFKRSTIRNRSRWKKNSTLSYKRLVKNTDVYNNKSEEDKKPTFEVITVPLQELIFDDNNDPECVENIKKTNTILYYPFQNEKYLDRECYPNVDANAYVYYV